VGGGCAKRRTANTACKQYENYGRQSTWTLFVHAHGPSEREGHSNVVRRMYEEVCKEMKMYRNYIVVHMNEQLVCVGMVGGPRQGYRRL